MHLKGSFHKKWEYLFDIISHALSDWSKEYSFGITISDDMLEDSLEHGWFDLIFPQLSNYYFN